MSSAKYDSIVIGAGHNGLTCAALLAKSGKKVLVLEKREVVGGLGAGEEFHPSFRSVGLLHDTAQVRLEVVKKLGLERFGLKFYSEAPGVFVPQKKEDGRGLFIHSDPRRMADNEISGTDKARYLEYRYFITKIRKIVRELFNEVPPSISNKPGALLSLAKKALMLRMLGSKDMTEVLRIVPMCVADWLNEWFQSDLLKTCLAAPAIYGTFTGPWSPGSNANLLLHECLAGVPVKGGPQELIRALEASAKANGVEIRLSSAVSEIKVSGGKVSGVLLADGEEISGSSVIASCDPKQIFLKLLPGKIVGYELAHRITNLRARGTTAKVNLAIKGTLNFACRPEHTVEFARTGEDLNALERAFDEVKYGNFSKRPILDIFVPTISDPSTALAGHSVVSILVHFAPYALKGGWNSARRDELGDCVVRALEEYTPGISSSIIGRETLTPYDLAERYGLSGGHIHHGEHAIDQFLARPVPECAHYRTPIQDLFLCGSGSHPGGGISCAPGMLAARVVLA